MASVTMNEIKNVTLRSKKTGKLYVEPRKVETTKSLAYWAAEENIIQLTDEERVKLLLSLRKAVRDDVKRMPTHPLDLYKNKLGYIHNKTFFKFISSRIGSIDRKTTFSKLFLFEEVMKYIIEEDLMLFPYVKR